MSAEIQKDMVAVVDYRGTLTESGEVFDSSEGNEPLTFLVGHDQMIPGFEKALLEHKIGDSVSFDLSVEDAYGPHDPDGIKSLPLDQLPEGIEVGDQLAAETPNGLIPLRVTAVDDATVTIDLNHELAGKALTFEVTVVEIRPATTEELEHGHVHGPGGHVH